MLEANVKIHKELAVKGFRKARKFHAARDISYYYAVRLTIVWLVISLANALAGEEHLTTYHLLFLAALWIVASVHRYWEWYKEVGEKTEGWEFYAKLDEMGVTTDADSERRHEWSHYANYIEYDDYLQINDTRGEITFLPKTNELSELIEFTKTKIPEKQ